MHSRLWIRRWIPVAGVAIVLCAAHRADDAPAITLRYRPGLDLTHHVKSVFTTRSGGQVISGPPTDRVETVYLSETAELDTLGGRRMDITVDSMAILAGGQTAGVTPGGGYHMVVWSSHYDEQRHITPDTTDPRLLSLRHSIDGLAFDGAVPFPDAPVTKGKTWSAPVLFRVSGMLDSLGALRGTAKVKLKDLIVSGSDTTVVLEIHLTLRGPEIKFNAAVEQWQQIYGTISGEEQFSLTRGVTRTIDLRGTLTQESDIGGGNRPSLPLDVEFHRSLVDDH